MIVVDTTVLLYAKGEDHALRDPCRRLVEAIATGRLRATTTPEVIQELVHVRARRRTRADAVALGHAYADLLAPLTVVDAALLRAGLEIFGDTRRLGSFDAVLAAVVVATDAEALVTADASFADLALLTVVMPGTAAFDELIAA